MTYSNLHIFVWSKVAVSHSLVTERCSLSTHSEKLPYFSRYLLGEFQTFSSAGIVGRSCDGSFDRTSV